MEGISLITVRLISHSHIYSTYFSLLLASNKGKKKKKKSKNTDLRIRIIVPQITHPIVRFRIPEIHINRLSVSDVQEPIWFRWKPRYNLPPCSLEMLDHEFLLDLLVPTWFVQLGHFALKEHVGNLGSWTRLSNWRWSRGSLLGLDGCVALVFRPEEGKELTLDLKLDRATVGPAKRGKFANSGEGRTEEFVAGLGDGGPVGLDVSRYLGLNLSGGDHDVCKVEKC